MYEKILAGVDGSEFSIQALYHAVELSLIFDSELTVISVVDDMKLPFSAEYGLWARESHDELTRKVLESLNRVMLNIKEKHPELKIEARIEKGHPAKTIVDIAEKAGVSKGTVSAVINSKSTVKPSTRNNILKVIKELNFRSTNTLMK